VSFVPESITQGRIANSGCEEPLLDYSPDHRLEGLADLFRERNAQYGDSFLDFGPMAAAMLPKGIDLKTPDDWNRFALFFMCMVKLHRYAMKFESGGQQDSLDDLAVYAQMLAYVDKKGEK
jgi:hypothetical protein